MVKIGVLYPTAQNLEEYNQTSIMLINDSTIAFKEISKDMTEETELKLFARINSFLVYNEFEVYCKHHNRSFYMTWDEIRNAMNISALHLDNAIKYLLQKGIIKEGFREIL